MAAFSQAAYRKFGTSVRQWTVTALQSMKQLLASLDASELAQLRGNIFDEG